MPTHSSIHFYLNWAKERIDEMDATLASFEGKVSEVQADARTKANQTLADMRKKRDDFRDTVKKQAQANEAAWIREKARLESEWNAFETEAKKYVETFGKQIEQQQATFKRLATAQVKAWREAVDNLRTAGKEFAAQHQSEIDATVKRMEVDAATAEEKLQKLNQAGMQSWSALMGALGETRVDGSKPSKVAWPFFSFCIDSDQTWLLQPRVCEALAGRKPARCSLRIVGDWGRRMRWDGATCSTCAPLSFLDVANAKGLDVANTKGPYVASADIAVKWFCALYRQI